MKKLAGLLVACLLLFTGGQSLWARSDLITDLREAFGISFAEATDKQLKQFLKDRTNRSFAESMLKQIKHGQQLQHFLNNQTNKLPNMSKEALKYLGKKFIIDLLKLIGDRANIFWLSTGSQLIGVLSTINSGVSIFIRLSDALVAFDSRAMLNEYINGREHGQSPQFVFQDLYNVFQPVIDKIICFKIPFKCMKQGGVTEEDKQNFATYLEFSYQSWKLFNDQVRRNDVKRYILDNINRPPIANAGPDQTVQVGSTVQLDGSGSSDPDGDTLRYTWRFISRPAGSRARLSNPKIAKPTFIADKAGDYVLELTVDDGRGGTATDQVKITATTDINLFKENFEGDISGWTFTGFWHVQDNPQLVTNAYQGGCVTLPDNAHLPSATSGSKALWYGQATDGSFVGSNPDTISPGCTSSQPNSGTALSPMVDLTTASAASLKFQSWFEIESVDADRYDLMKIEVLNAVSDEALGCYLLNPSEDVNGPANQPFTSGGFNSPAQWVQQSVDLTPFIGQKVRFRFTFDTRDRLYNGFRGWLIDDVVVSNQTAPTSSTLRECPGLGSASSNPRGLSGKDIIKNPSFNLSIKLDAVQFMADGQDIQEIQVRVFNLAGREVYNSGFVTGSRLYWNGLTNDGRRLANGVYLYVVRVRGFDGREYVSEVRKLVILR